MKERKRYEIQGTRYEIRHPNGCHIHDNCLNCPLPVCIEDLTKEKAGKLLQQREYERIDRKIRELTDRGMTRRQAVTTLAESIGMKDPSNIYRRLKRQRGRERA